MALRLMIVDDNTHFLNAARGLLDREGMSVLLLNEPTRGIDVGARAEIYRLMREFCAAESR